MSIQDEIKTPSLPSFLYPDAGKNNHWTITYFGVKLLVL